MGREGEPTGGVLLLGFLVKQWAAGNQVPLRWEDRARLEGWPPAYFCPAHRFRQASSEGE